VSIVVPVYQGSGLSSPSSRDRASGPALETPRGALSGQRGDLGSRRRDRPLARGYEALARRYQFVTTVWLSRNYGQHPATLAGMGLERRLVATLDEDVSRRHRYLESSSTAPSRTMQPSLRHAVNDLLTHVGVNAMSLLAKVLTQRFIGKPVGGERSTASGLSAVDVARSLAGLLRQWVYLDVPCPGWSVSQRSVCGPSSGARRPPATPFSKLAAHFGRLMLPPARAHFGSSRSWVRCRASRHRHQRVRALG